MMVPAVHWVVEAAIERASQATGVDPTFLLGTARRESGADPSARARTSSAAGLFQFVDQTWLATLKKHGAKYGYVRYAELISQGPDGRYYVTGATARRAVMGLRLDPHAAALMAGELTTDHAAYLRGHMGRTPTAGELYAAHVLGAQGLALLFEEVQRAPATSAAELFPQAAAANRAIFYRDGRAATVTEVYDSLTRVGRVRAATPVDEGFARYAQARRVELLRHEPRPVQVTLRGPLAPGAPVRGRPLFSTVSLRGVPATGAGKGASS